VTISLRNALTIVVAGALLVACGQRGPLTLPGEPREDVPPVAAPRPMASPLPRTTPAPAPAADADTTSDESEANRRNRTN
jgi:predicted small lipoprotein YifL